MALDQRIEIVEGAEQPLVRKWALSAAGVAALGREADRLERARHPGVVVLVAAADDHLDLEWAGAETLELTRLTRTAAAQALTAVAATVADLHELGIVHGRIDESHVVIGPDQKPRLCGLRGTEPGRPEPGPADDVADLGLLLERSLGMGADQDVVPERRWRTWPRSGARDRALEAIVERATDPDPARRPTARALARSMAEVVPGFNAAGHPPRVEADTSPPGNATVTPPADRTVTLRVDAAMEQDQATATPSRARGVRLMVGARGRPATTAGPHPTREPTPRPELRADPTSMRDLGGDGPDPEPPGAATPSGQDLLPARAAPIRLVVGLGLLLLAGAVVTLRQPTPGGTDRPAATITRPTGRATISNLVPSTTTSTASPPTSAPAPTPSASRPTVEFGGTTYEVGEPGDQVTVADWDCDGSESVGLVRPATGEVFVFDDWPKTGEANVAPRTRIVRAQELVGSPPGPGCRSPRVRLDDGTLVALPSEAGG